MRDIQILNPDVPGRPLGPYSQFTRAKASEFLFTRKSAAADLRIQNAQVEQARRGAAS